MGGVLGVYFVLFCNIHIDTLHEVFNNMYLTKLHPFNAIGNNIISSIYICCKVKTRAVALLLFLRDTHLTLPLSWVFLHNVSYDVAHVGPDMLDL